MSLSRKQRERIVDVMRADMGLPSLAKERRRRFVRMLRAEEGILDAHAVPRRPRGKPQPIDMTELHAIRKAHQEWRRDRRTLESLLGMARSKGGVDCLACGEMLLPKERLLVAVTPTALAISHSFRCRARGW